MFCWSHCETYVRDLRDAFFPFFLSRRNWDCLKTRFMSQTGLRLHSEMVYVQIAREAMVTARKSIIYLISIGKVSGPIKMYSNVKWANDTVTTRRLNVSKNQWCCTAIISVQFIDALRDASGRYERVICQRGKRIYLSSIDWQRN